MVLSLFLHDAECELLAQGIVSTQFKLLLGYDAEEIVTRYKGVSS